ncbi:MAG: cob(I)yrinic acid a,c-diamide adenosyltransferase [Desulfobacterales bacterium]
MMKNSEKGYIQIYTGNGKGKTTAALGLALRAAGHGMKTYMGQFMKGQWYGELTSLKDHPHITIEQYGDTTCIRKEDVMPKHINQAVTGLGKAERAMHSGLYDILILDEVHVAVWFGLLTEEEVLYFLNQRVETMEIILTGRNATDKLIEAADLVSDIQEIKHYYHQGLSARNGIER